MASARICRGNIKFFTKTYTFEHVGTTIIKYKVGERTKYNGAVQAESEEVIYSVQVIGGVVDITNIESKLGEISVDITEVIGVADAINVQWSIETSGGIADLLWAFSSDGEIDNLPAGETENVSTWGFIFGLGLMNVNISVNAAGMQPITKTMRAIVVGPFIFGLREV